MWTIGAIDVGRTGCNTAGSVEVTLDTGAGASCWPKGLLPNFPTGPKDKGAKFVAANGQPLQYLGNKEVHFRPGHGGAQLSLLVAVSRNKQQEAARLRGCDCRHKQPHSDASGWRIH